MTFIVSGINHKTASVEIRERLSFDDEHLNSGNLQLLEKSILREATIVSTCNRTEIYGVSERPEDAKNEISRFLSEYKLNGHVLPKQIFYFKKDIDAIFHLFRVAAGLDSMVIGEPQILGQIKNAYAHASYVGTTDFVLHKVFHSAFRVGKRARAETKIGGGAVSVASVSIDLAKKIFNDFSDKKILLIGAGEMAIQTLTQLNSVGAKEIYIINRTFKRAEVLAKNIGGIAMPFDDLKQALINADMVVASTSAERAILDTETVKTVMTLRKNRPLFLIDISVPRNIDPAVRQIYNTYLYDVDDLQTIVSQNLGARKKEIPKVEKIIAEEVEKFMSWYRSLSSLETIKVIRDHFEEIRKKAIQQNKKFFKEEDWEQMEKFSKSLMKKFLHHPIMYLRSCSNNGKLCERCAIIDVFGLEVEWEKSEL